MRLASPRATYQTGAGVTGQLHPLKRVGPRNGRWPTPRAGWSRRRFAEGCLAAGCADVCRRIGYQWVMFHVKQVEQASSGGRDPGV